MVEIVFLIFVVGKLFSTQKDYNMETAQTIVAGIRRGKTVKHPYNTASNLDFATFDKYDLIEDYSGYSQEMMKDLFKAASAFHNEYFKDDNGFLNLRKNDHI